MCVVSSSYSGSQSQKKRLLAKVQQECKQEPGSEVYQSVCQSAGCKEPYHYVSQDQHIVYSR